MGRTGAAFNLPAEEQLLQPLGVWEGAVRAGERAETAQRFTQLLPASPPGEQALQVWKKTGQDCPSCVPPFSGYTEKKAFHAISAPFPFPKINMTSQQHCQIALS